MHQLVKVEGTVCCKGCKTNLTYKRTIDEEKPYTKLVDVTCPFCERINRIKVRQQGNKP